MAFRTFLASTFVVGLVAACALTSAQSASADASGGSAATITVVGGSLAITVPTGTSNLGSVVDSLGGETISGPLGQVQVSDARNAAAGAGWVVSVISTAFSPTAGPPIPAAGVGYTVGPIVKVGTAVYTANNPLNLVAVSPAITATAITGDNSATWTPTINVVVPSGMATGLYTATITHSVL